MKKSTITVLLIFAAFGYSIIPSWAQDEPPVPEWIKNINPADYALIGKDISPMFGSIEKMVATANSRGYSIESDNETSEVSVGNLFIHENIFSKDRCAATAVEMMVYENADIARMMWKRSIQNIGEDTGRITDNPAIKGHGDIKYDTILYDNIVAKFYVINAGVCSISEPGISQYTLDNEFRTKVADLWIDKVSNLKQKVRTLTVTGYDGREDFTHLPMTFEIKLEEEGKPLKGEYINFKFLGDVGCLGDSYAYFDEKKYMWWVRTGNNFAVENVQYKEKTDDNGRLTIRLFMDFGRMKLRNLELPCTINFEAMTKKNRDDELSLLKQAASIKVNSPAFVREIFFLSGNDPQWGVGRWIRLGTLGSYSNYLDEKYVNPPAITNVGEKPMPPKPSYPIPFTIPRRVTIDHNVFEPPNLEGGYYFPIRDELTIDLCNPQSIRGQPGFEARPGDGIGIIVDWLDGTRVSLEQKYKEPVYIKEGDKVVRYDDCFLSGKIGDLKIDESREGAYIRFAIGQGDDWIIETFVVAGATAINPTLGAVTAVVVVNWQNANDLLEIEDILTHDYKVIWIKSKFALAGKPDGTATLYTFEGSPGVTDKTGKEIVVNAGEAINFNVSGDISQPKKGEPSTDIVAMLETMVISDPKIEKAADVPVGTARKVPIKEMLEVPIETSTKSQPGIGTVVAIGIIGLIYLIRRRK